MAKVPIWLLPAGMAAWNVAFFLITLVGEGRVKPNVALFAWRYTLSVPPAIRGDIHPFIVVFQS